jgi:hypothetical protein
MMFEPVYDPDFDDESWKDLVMTQSGKNTDNTFCKWCLEHLNGKSQKEHDAECPIHPCFDCNDYGTEECVTCIYTKARWLYG